MNKKSPGEMWLLLLAGGGYVWLLDMCGPGCWYGLCVSRARVAILCPRALPVIKWCGNGCSVFSLYMLEINCIPEFVCLLWSVYMSICCRVKVGGMDGGELVLT